MTSDTQPTSTRLDRFRTSPALRRLVRETVVRPHDLVLPIFVTDDPGMAGPIQSLPGVHRHLPDETPNTVTRAAEAGLAAILLFGVTTSHDTTGSAADGPTSPVIRAIHAIKQQRSDIPVIVDVCLCAYTSDGACTLTNATQGDTLRRHAAIAAAYARAGADAVAPSGAIDGVTRAIRYELDRQGFLQTPIISYAVKLASALYGPFRDASASGLREGDRAHHQIDPANAIESRREARQDLDEDADAIIVKPAGWQGDLIAALRRDTDRPVWAYQVSGEHAMLHAAAHRGWLDRRRAILESLTAVKRAGAHRIITYAALDAAEWLNERR
ncbi:MAG: porphobilinogen synthase [Phycisphaerales bacterium]